MKIILKIHLVSLLLLSVAFAGQQERFPKMPNLTETPGRLCTDTKAYRYPEKIAYCERAVDSYTKNAVIQKYDHLFGYQIETMDRAAFKIDHLIPLCAGGANSEDNLWPQHRSVYEITDPIEPILCQKMLEGKLLQADAVKIVLQAKTHLDQVPALIKQLNSL
ncbi:MAG: hypothetical protein ACXVLQ_06165 [Bacteriovorax sp.]